MTYRRRPVVRLKAEVLWDRLTRLQRSQNWLADRLGISRSHLSRLLNRSRAPSGDLRLRLQQVLEVEDFNELFCIEYPGHRE